MWFLGISDVENTYAIAENGYTGEGGVMLIATSVQEPQALERQLTIIQSTSDV